MPTVEEKHSGQETRINEDEALQHEVVEIGNARIELPGWLPRCAVDPKTGARHRQYWEMIASGSIVLTGEQLDQALKLADMVERLIGRSEGC